MLILWQEVCPKRKPETTFASMSLTQLLLLLRHSVTIYPSSLLLETRSIPMSVHIRAFTAPKSSSNLTASRIIWGSIPERSHFPVNFAEKRLMWSTTWWSTDAYIVETEVYFKSSVYISVSALWGILQSTCTLLLCAQLESVRLTVPFAANDLLLNRVWTATPRSFTRNAGSCIVLHK